jgi:precorrin isomerase
MNWASRRKAITITLKALAPTAVMIMGTATAMIMGMITVIGTTIATITSTTRADQLTASPPFDYLRDPAAIYRRSFEIVRAECDLATMPPAVAGMVVRLVHACGMSDIVPDLRWTDDVADAARNALHNGAPVIADCRMAADGIIAKRLPAGNDILCTLNDPGAYDRAAEVGTTRSAASVDLWRDHLGGAVVTIGNAPTALFRLLEILAEGAGKPAAILAFPVGFVGAAESKDALIVADIGVPYITLTGRRGGSAMAAAAVNAVSGTSEDDQ